MAITKIEKRDGRVVDFDQSKITNAILKAIIAVGEEKKVNANVLSDQVVEELQESYGPHKIPNVEDIQDVVEKILIKNVTQR